MPCSPVLVPPRASASSTTRLLSSFARATDSESSASRRNATWKLPSPTCPTMPPRRSVSSSARRLERGRALVGDELARRLEIARNRRLGAAELEEEVRRDRKVPAGERVQRRDRHRVEQLAPRQLDTGRDQRPGGPAGRL